MQAHNLTVLPLTNGQLRVEITLSDHSQGERLSMFQTCDKLDVDIKKWRDTRSTIANGCLWATMSKIAMKIGSTKDDVYLEMLKRYSHQFTHVVVKPEVVDKIKREWRTVEEVGSLEVNGSDGVQLKCYFGSSTFDTKQFSVFLEGVLSEAKELGIPTIQDEEFKRLMTQYEGERA